MILSGRGREVLRLSDVFPTIFLAWEPWDRAKRWGNCSVGSIGSIVTLSFAAYPFWAKTQDLLSVWLRLISLCENMRGCWVTGKKRTSCPFSHVIRKCLNMITLGLPQLKAWPPRLYLMQLMQIFRLWYFFRNTVGVTFSSCFSFDCHKSRKKMVDFFFFFFP